MEKIIIKINIRIFNNDVFFKKKESFYILSIDNIFHIVIVKSIFLINLPKNSGSNLIILRKMYLYFKYDE